MVLTDRGEVVDFSQMQLFQRSFRSFLCLAILVLVGCLYSDSPHAESGNLLNDSSFEIPKPKDQFGLVFAKWTGWKYEGNCAFEVGEIAHTGKSSAALTCADAGKIRIGQERELEPGRYRITAYLRGV